MTAAQLLSALFDAQARQRIATAYESGWITAEDALELLLSCDLIEAPCACRPADEGADG